MSKHTPGPYHVDIRSGCVGVKSSAADSSPGMGCDYPNNLLCYTARGAKYENDYWSLPEETIANMYLFAAAPDLYETLCRMSYIFMQVVQAVEIDIEGTRFEVENKVTGEKGSLSLQEVFEAASSAINKVHGEINE